MRLSSFTLLFAASAAVVNAYDFDSRDISSRDIYDASPSLQFSRRAQHTRDLIAARDFIDSILEERSVFWKRSVNKAAEQKAAATELQKWSQAVLDIKKSLSSARPGSKEKSMEGDMKKCLAFNEEGASYFRAVATGAKVPSGVRKPTTAPCKWNGNGFYPKWM
jgi:hypothetical protein